MIKLVSLAQALLVAEHLSFSRAARMLGVGQPAVSRRVRALEDELGVSLFERSLGGLRLTDAGRRFVAVVGPALEEIDHAVRVAASAGVGGEGLIRIGILSSLSGGFLRDLLVRFRASHPTIVLEIAEGSANEHVARLTDRQLDVAFVTGTPSASHCDILPLWEGRVWVALPERHPLALVEAIHWEALMDARFIVNRAAPGPAMHDLIIRRLTAFGRAPPVERFAVGWETLMHMVALGFGLSLVNEAAVTTRYPEVVFRPLAAAEDRLLFSAVWLPGNDNPALRRLLSLTRSLSTLPGGARSPAMNRASIGAISLAGSPAGCPVSRASASA